MGKTLREWLQEGEELYAMTLREYQGLESQVRHLEAQMASKKEELDQIAHVIGKPPVAEAARAARVAAAAAAAAAAAPSTQAPAQPAPPASPAPAPAPVAVTAATIPAHAVQIIDTHAPGSIPASRNTIARALTGRGLGG